MRVVCAWAACTTLVRRSIGEWVHLFAAIPTDANERACALVPAYAKVCTITGPAIAVAGPARSGVRFCSIHARARLFDSSAPA